MQEGQVSHMRETVVEKKNQHETDQSILVLEGGFQITTNIGRAVLVQKTVAHSIGQWTKTRLQGGLPDRSEGVHQ